MASRRNFLLAAGAGMIAGTAHAQSSAPQTTPVADTSEKALQNKDGLALALGGGAAKAFAHIPYLESLDALGVRPKEVAGTSMGSILGALYCDGMSGREIHEYIVHLLTQRRSLLKRLLIDTGNTWGSLINIFRPAVIEPEVLFAAIFPEGMAKDFSELEIPLTIIGTDFFRQSEVVMRDGPLLSAISASSCLPVLLTPVRRNGRVLIDGGYVNPTPFDLLDKVRYVTVAIDVTGTDFEDTGKIPSSFETFAGSISITQSSIVAEKLKCARPDIFIEPAVGGFNPMDFFQVEDIIAAAEVDQDNFKRRIEKIIQ